VEAEDDDDVDDSAKARENNPGPFPPPRLGQNAAKLRRGDRMGCCSSAGAERIGSEKQLRPVEDDEDAVTPR
jgi:hypothetical protein